MESTKEMVDRYLANDEDLVVGAYLAHYGTPRHSGRYPWGSGKDPYQSLGSSAKAGEKFIKSFSKKSRVEKQNDKRREKTKAAQLEKKKQKAGSKKSKYRNEKAYVKTLSDEELRRINARDQMEATYLKNHPQKQPLPKKLVDKAVKDIIVPAVTEVVKEQGKVYIKGKLNAAAQKMVNEAVKAETKNMKKKAGTKPLAHSDPCNNYLAHYGTPRHSGRYPWGSGKDPYQHNSDESLTNLERNRRTMDDVNDIVNSMSRKDKQLLGMHGKKYQTLDEGKNIVKRFIKRVDGVPVSFFDVTGDSTGVAVTIGTRSGEKYRNKGYAKTLARKGKKWLDEHYDDFDQIVWWARKDNAGSIKTAKDIGFELDESSVLPDDPWIKYQYKKK